MVPVQQYRFSEPLLVAAGEGGGTKGGIPPELAVGECFAAETFLRVFFLEVAAGRGGVFFPWDAFNHPRTHPIVFLLDLTLLRCLTSISLVFIACFLCFYDTSILSALSV